MGGEVDGSEMGKKFRGEGRYWREKRLGRRDSWLPTTRTRKQMFGPTEPLHMTTPVLFDLSRTF